MWHFMAMTVAFAAAQITSLREKLSKLKADFQLGFFISGSGLNSPFSEKAGSKLE